MISWISSWAQGVIISVIIASIIEMILPEGSSKKYIKVVVGIFILFNIISPAITKFSNKDINISDFLDIDKYKNSKEVSSINLQEKNTLNIKEIYETNLKTDIKSKINKKGFEVSNIDVEILDNEEYLIQKIDVTIKGEIKDEEEDKKNKSNIIGIIDNVEKISIELSNKTTKEEKEYKISSKDANHLKEYLSDVYDMKVTNISIH